MRFERRSAAIGASVLALCGAGGVCLGGIVETTYIHHGLNCYADGYVQKDETHFRVDQYAPQNYTPPLNVSSVASFSSTDSYDGAYYDASYAIHFDFSQSPTEFHFAVTSSASAHASVDASLLHGRAQATSNAGGRTSVDFHVISGPVLYTGTHELTDFSGLLSFPSGSVLAPGFYTVVATGHISSTNLSAGPGQSLSQFDNAALSSFHFTAIPAPASAAVVLASGLTLPRRRNRA